MTRSLSFPYLFVILAVSYLGGTLLFRELSEAPIAKILLVFDARVVKGHEVNLLLPALTVILFFGLAILLARFTYTRFLVLLIGAVKCVLFGISSAYLLAKGLKVYEYALWWFPFQLVICFILLLFAAVLAPPFFMKTTGKKERNHRTLIVLFIVAVLLVISENLLYFFLIQ